MTTKFDEGKNVWNVENYSGNNNVKIEVKNNKEIVSIYKCTNSVFVVSNKCNKIVLDNCKKCGVLFESTITGVDVVRSSGCQIQCKVSVPSFSIDNSDGITVFLTQENYSTIQFYTSKSSETNITVAGASEEEDPKTYIIPSQFISKFVDGKFTTQEVSHI
eukprot:Anaeramoba_flamelloidesa325353_803.p2 GENE.a325353_803~~a325353_803.p2  ORF type:complete len:161 (-),score=38.64 a325353_803:312-794(-)